jgi:hypothetical protein
MIDVMSLARVVFSGETGRAHGYHEPTAADVPVGARRIVVKLRARRTG